MIRHGAIPPSRVVAPLHSLPPRVDLGPRPGHGVGLGLRPLLCLWLCLSAGCAATLPLPTFPDHVPIHERAEYAKGAGAAAYLGRVERNDGRLAYLKELDTYIVLLQQIHAAFLHTATTPLPPRATPAYRDAYADELRQLQQEGDHVGELLGQFFDLGSAKHLIEILPEIGEAERISQARGAAAKKEEVRTGWAPWSAIAGLSADALLNDRRLLGSGPATCGAETPDPTSNPESMPDFFIKARDYDGTSEQVVVSPELQRLYKRIRTASRPQRKAMGLYGPYTSIAKSPGKPGETWTFAVGSVARSAAGSTAIDYRPRALSIECDFDGQGNLTASRERVLDQNGETVSFAPTP